MYVSYDSQQLARILRRTRKSLDENRHTGIVQIQFELYASRINRELIEKIPDTSIFPLLQEPAIFSRKQRRTGDEKYSVEQAEDEK